MRRICSDLYYKFVNKSPKRLNTLYESMHNQCCKKNCGVWNYLHVNIIFLEIVFWYEVPIDKHWVRKEDISIHKSEHYVNVKLKHHFCNKCNYDFYITI